MPNYGGVIDIHYRLRALHDAGVRFCLHVWYKGAPPDPALLLPYSEQVFFYPRIPPFRYRTLNLPYMAGSRISPELNKRIAADQAPVWFEGLHTTGILVRGMDIGKRKLLLRSHNLESRYYQELAGAESNWLKKTYLQYEHRLLHTYEQQVIPRMDGVFSISTEELSELILLNPATTWLPAFVQFRNQKISRLPVPDPDDFRILYHGNFQVRENLHNARWLAQLFSQTSIPGVVLVLAGKGLESVSFPGPAVEMHPNPERMDAILDTADLVVIPGRQQSGVKIKLLESLAAGKRVLAAPASLTGSGLEKDVPVFHSEKELREKIIQAQRGKMETEFLKGLTAFFQLYHPENAIREILKALA